MKPRTLAVLAVLAIILGFVTFFAGYNWLNKQAQKIASESNKALPVVVAADNIEPGQKILASHLKVANWPAELVPPSYISSAAQATGKTPTQIIVKGEVIVPSKLADDLGKVSLIVPKGFLAVTVKVDEVIGVAGFVKAGDRVDMIVTVDKADFNKNPVSKLVLQDVIVIAAGTHLYETKDEKSKKYSVVTLQLLPEQAEKVAMAVSEGKILLALRNLNDREEYLTNGQLLPSLITGVSMPKPNKDAPAPSAKPFTENTRSMIIIRGVDKSDDSL